MPLKSTPERYGRIAVALHWTIAIAAILALKSGFTASAAAGTPVAAGQLRIHLAAGATTAALTLLRVVWWLALDMHPTAHASPAMARRATRIVHALFYVIPLGMAASGVGMILLTGAGEQLFAGASAHLPEFRLALPRAPHGLGARLLLGLIALHVAAALWHQFVRRDRIFDRMRFGG